MTLEKRAEIEPAMKRAIITSLDKIEWYETCYGPSPLQREHKMVYDQCLTNIETQPVDIVEKV